MILPESTGRHTKGLFLTEIMTLKYRDLIAPCGINCRLCQRYKRAKNPCPGCRGDDSLKLPSCIACNIKSCHVSNENGEGFCFTCSEYPCAKIKRLDKRYVKSYGLSVLENLHNVEVLGLDRFVDEQQRQWSCVECGAILCMHKPQCRNCGKLWRK